jgi:hypothetical protein
MEKVFNEWMRRFIETPEEFKCEWQTVKKYLEEQNKGEEPSYGAECAAYMRKLSLEMEVPLA